jgi:hypothetical protein
MSSVFYRKDRDSVFSVELAEVRLREITDSLFDGFKSSWDRFKRLCYLLELGFLVFNVLEFFLIGIRFSPLKKG